MQPFITALPEVQSRTISDKDRIVVLASDGVWEYLSEESVKNCIGQYYKKKRDKIGSPTSASSSSSYYSLQSINSNFNSCRPRIRHMRMLPMRSLWEESQSSCCRHEEDIICKRKVSDAIVSCVLHKVRKKHKMKSIKNVMSLPNGSCRRSKHDDITNMVIDLEGFIF